MENVRKYCRRYRHLFRKAVASVRSEGMSGLVRRYIEYRRFVKTASPDRIRAKVDGRTSPYFFVEDVDLSKPNPFVERPIEKGKPLTINWVIPDLAQGSGGHATLFRIISFLERFGHTNRIHLFAGEGAMPYRNAQQVKSAVEKHFMPLQAEFVLGVGGMKDSDVLVATSWHTAYPCYAVQNTKRKFYVIQDYEPAFYPVGSAQLFAEQTYRMGYRCLTAGPWLASLLREKYECPASFFWLAYDNEVYKPDRAIKRSKNTVCFYGRFVTARRGFELGVLALDIVKRKRPDVNVIIFGWDASNQPIPFAHKNIGLASPQELASLYTEATVGVVFSLTNYSLVPQEMMGCGLPVVELEGENTKGVYREHDTLVLAEPDPHHIAEKILRLLEHPEERENLSRRGSEWAGQFSWEESARQVEKAFVDP